MKNNFKKFVWVKPKDLGSRIIHSLVPPLTQRSRKIQVDFLGPIIAVLILIIIINYGSDLKQIDTLRSSFQKILFYLVFMPVLCFCLNVIGQSQLNFLQVFVIIGYSLYGHVFTLFASLLISKEKNNFLFFISLIVFGGLSTFRLVLLQIQSIPLPGARLLICSIVSVIHILSLVFLHFTYMHPTFIYGKNSVNLRV